jgi:hypothetical protein
MELQINLKNLNTKDLVCLAGLFVGEAPRAFLQTTPDMAVELAKVIQEDLKFRADEQAAGEYNLIFAFDERDPSGLLERLQAAYSWLSDTSLNLSHDPELKPACGVLDSIAAQVQFEIGKRVN